MKTTYFLLFLFIVIPVFAQEFYDEVYFENGRVRPQYASFVKVYNKMSAKQREKFLQQSLRDFQGDNKLAPIPRVLTQSEFDVLQKGVEQRAKAIQKFLREVYSGTTSYEKVIPPKLVYEIMQRSGEIGYLDKINPDTIAFPYGPDIIRTTSGAWAVIEDNPGYIGGVGDLKAARDIMIKNQPQYTSLVKNAKDPLEYYKEIVERARMQAIPRGGRVVMVMTPPYPDKEDQRLVKLYGDQGVDVVTPNTKKKLMIDSTGVYLSIPGEDVERVGYVIMNAEHAFLDVSHEGTRSLAVLQFAKSFVSENSDNKVLINKVEQILHSDQTDSKKVVAQLEFLLMNEGLSEELSSVEKKNFSGLVDAIASGKVASNYSPGVDFIGDKGFYPYVDDLVRHYLHEEPVIQNIPTHAFAKYDTKGTAKINKKLFDRLFDGDEFKHWVFKGVDGRGGDSVWIGPKMQSNEVEALKLKILSDPERYIAQRFTPLSQVDGNIVDIRMITQVGRDYVYVSEIPWGRGLPKDGNGKVNLSDSGREFTVIVLPNHEVHCDLNFVKEK